MVVKLPRNETKFYNEVLTWLLLVSSCIESETAEVFPGENGKNRTS